MQIKLVQRPPKGQVLCSPPKSLTNHFYIHIHWAPETLPSALYVVSHLIRTGRYQNLVPAGSLQDRYQNHPHVRDEETETQGGELNSPGSAS